MPINPKYCKILELDKILSMLADYTCCEYAKERALNIKPHTEYNFVLDEIKKTNETFNLTLSHGTPSFIKMDDPEQPLKLSKAGGVLSPRAIINVGKILRQSRLLIEWHGQVKAQSVRVKPIFEQLYPIKDLEKRISSVFVSEDEISDNASDELAEIRKKIRRLGIKIKDDLDKLIRSNTYQKALQDTIVTQRDGRYVVPVKAEYRGVVSGLVHDTSSSGATLFIEPMSVVDANNNIKVLKSNEKAEIDRILAELSANIGEYHEVIADNFETVIRLNIYFAKATLASNMNAMLPNLSTDGTIRLNKARHPLIAKDKIVPITLELGKDYTSLVVTGPNTGGKTVTLKTMGLLTLMTMCGMLIPVSDDSTISIFEKILVDMGDEQSIAQSLSTFSGHMTNIVSILKVADDKSLVLVDELGSGTDPVEGASLATAILEELRMRNTIVGATTHYSELKIYALQTEGVMNASCEFDVNTLQPTYRLLIGTPGRSNAFEISRKLGLSDSILEKAGEFIAKDKKNFEDVIDNLETSRQEFEQKSFEFAKETAELRSLKEEIQNANRDTLNEKEKILNTARAEAKRLVHQVKQDSALILEELAKIKMEKDAKELGLKTAQGKTKLRGQLDKLDDIANPVMARTNENYVLPRPLKPGDNVLIVDIDKTGTVIEAPKGNTVLIQMGIIKSRVNVKTVRLNENASQPIKKKGSVGRKMRSNKVTKGTMEVDLRGQTVDEGIMELELFISNSLLSNVGTITIIHGKGTGALRSGVHAYLKNSKHIKTYRLGLYGEGETGVTIAELK